MSQNKPNTVVVLIIVQLILSVMAAVFSILKLNGIVDWSWSATLAPAYALPAVAIGFGAVLLVIVVFTKVLTMLGVKVKVTPEK